MKREERWEQFLDAFVDRHGRLRALQEELLERKPDIMSSYLTYAETITVHLRLSAHGDALIFGTNPARRYVPGLQLKQRLFAWHEASFYGTDLELQSVKDAELVVLPAEQVIPFSGN